MGATGGHVERCSGQIYAVAVGVRSSADAVFCRYNDPSVILPHQAQTYRSQVQPEPRQAKREPRRRRIYPFGKEYHPPPAETAAYIPS